MAGNAVLPFSTTHRNTTIINRGRRVPQQAPNEYDSCLAMDQVMWNDLVAHGGLKKICCPRGRKPYAQRPWIAMPAEGRRFKPIGILAVPGSGGFDGTDTVVPFVGGLVRVPLGYDGVITDVMCGIDPGADGITGFVEGSGDLVWRLAAERRFLRDLGNLQTQVGSLTAPNPVPRGGLRIYSGDQIVWTVAFATGADSRISPTARIIVSLTGWYWPR